MSRRLLASLSRLYRWICALFGVKTLGLTREEAERALAPPAECPSCCGLLRLDGAEIVGEVILPSETPTTPGDGEPRYVCVGLPTRADVVEHLFPKLSPKYQAKGLLSTPPCGWSGRAADYGTLWG